jgi:hypothetical protein
MPTTFSWTYEGDEGDEEADGVQRLVPGDVGIDDEEGEVVVLSMDGADLVCEYVDKGGDKVRERLPAARIRAKERRSAPARKEPTGRPGQAKDGIFQFFGAAGQASTPPPAKDKAKGKAAKGFGKPKASGKAGKKASAPDAAKRTPCETACSVRTLHRSFSGVGRP